MKNYILLGLSLGVFLAAKGINTTAFGGYVDYSSSIKDKAHFMGVYGSYFAFPYKLEADIEYTQVKYKDSTPTYKQSDVTLVASYYKGTNSSFKAGIHNIIINQKDNPNNYDYVAFVGLSYYELYNFNLGIDVYRSDYDGFNVVQVSPKYGVNFGDYKSKIGSFYAEAKANFINISKPNITNETGYENLDLTLQNFNGPFTTELFASIGKSAYKVANNGFSVYNLGEEYKYKYKTSLAYNFKNGATVKVSYSKSKFSENNNDAKSNSYMLSISKNW